MFDLISANDVSTYWKDSEGNIVFIHSIDNLYVGTHTDERNYPIRGSTKNKKGYYRYTFNGIPYQAQKARLVKKLTKEEYPEYYL